MFFGACVEWQVIVYAIFKTSNPLFDPSFFCSDLKNKAINIFGSSPN